MSDPKRNIVVPPEVIEEIVEFIADFRPVESKREAVRSVLIDWRCDATAASLDQIVDKIASIFSGRSDAPEET